MGDDAMESDGMMAFDLLAFNKALRCSTVSKVATTGTTPKARVYASSLAVGEKIVLFGGQCGAFGFNQSPPTWFSDVHLFDTVTKSWTEVETTGDKPAGRGAPTACL